MKEPIRACEEFGRYRLVDSARRLAAHVQLGRTEIAVRIDEADVSLRLAEIKAHMLRGDLTMLDRARCVTVTLAIPPIKMAPARTDAADI